MEMLNTQATVPIVAVLLGFFLILVFSLAVSNLIVSWLSFNRGRGASQDAYQKSEELAKRWHESEKDNQFNSGAHKGRIEGKQQEAAAQLSQLRSYGEKISSLEDLYQLGYRHGSEGLVRVDQLRQDDGKGLPQKTAQNKK
jgi:hypothetical protein